MGGASGKLGAVGRFQGKLNCLNIAAALSLVLAVMVAILWIRSSYCRDVVIRKRSVFVGIRSNSDVMSFGSGAGGLLFSFVRETTVRRDSGDPTLQPAGFGQWEHAVRPASPHRLPTERFVAYGFHFGSGRDVILSQRVETTTTDTGIIIPFWFLLLVFTPLPAWRMFRRSVRAEKNVGAVPCFVCGYDLRASVDRCPECGMPRLASANVLV